LRPGNHNGHSNMPKVLIVQPSCPAYRRGFFEALARKLDFLLICSTASADGAKSDIANLACPVELVDVYQLGGRIAWQKGVVKRVLRERPKVLVVNGNPRYVSTVAAIAVARLKGTPVVWWGHAMSSTSRPWRAFLRKRLMHAANRLFLYYPEETELLPASLRARVVGLDNSVDTSNSLRIYDQITASDVEQFRIRQGLGDDPLILTIGRLTKKAGVGLLLEALHKLGAGNSRTRLAVLGGGAGMEPLKARADELGLSDRVFFVGPVYDEAQIGLWMRASKLFVYGGAVGLSLIHAFCYALPAIISRPLTGHMPEALLFKEGAYGATFEQGDAGSLAAVLHEQLAHEDNLQAMGLAAQKLVRQRLSQEKMADNFVRGLPGA